MSSIDIILMGLKNLYRRKGRTSLTVLGVIIGTAAIITMISIGIGIKKTFIEQVSKFGKLTIINIYPSSGGMIQSGGGYGQSKSNLDDRAVKDLSKIKNVVAAIPILQTDGVFVSGKYINMTTIKGINPDYMKYLELKLSSGKLLAKGSQGVIYGGQVATNFTDPKKRYNSYSSLTVKPKVNILTDKIFYTVDSSYGQQTMPAFDSSDSNNNSQNQTQPTQTRKVKAKMHRISTEGVIQQGDYENDYTVFMDIDVVKSMIREKNVFNRANSQGSSGMNNSTTQNGYTNIMVKVNATDNVKDVQDQVKKLGYDCYSQIDSLNEVEKASNIIQLVLGGIAAISLFVASLGITNTMIMAIYERTREIGIMKVIGAKISDIRKIFLFEAAMIGLLGGILGSILSFAASFVLNSMLGSGALSSLSGMSPMGGTDGATTQISIIPPWLVLFALAFTTMIGIISGYYPARRAMKLSAIQAIKTE